MSEHPFKMLPCSRCGHDPSHLHTTFDCLDRVTKERDDLRATVARLTAEKNEALGSLEYARLAANWLNRHAYRAHEYDRGYIHEVVLQIAWAMSALRASDAASGKGASNG